MIFRSAKPQEHPQLLRLLSATDSRWNSDRLFDGVSVPHNTLLCEHGGEIVAMVYLFPVSISGRLGYFMQPLSVAPAMLSTGIAIELIEYAKHCMTAAGGIFIATTTPPTDSPAEGWLSATGFDVCTILQRSELAINNLTLPDVKFSPVEPELITSLRAGYIKGEYLTFSQDTYAEFCGYWQRKHAMIALMPDGYGVFHSSENGVVFRELFFENVYSAAALISVVGKMQGCDRAVVFTAHNSRMFKDTALSVPYNYGSICSLSGDFKPQNVYMNMMFD